TFRFLFDSYIQQRRRMQFLEALLATLRTLFILFLVVMFCRFVMDESSKLLPTGSGGRDVLMLVDCSASMNAPSAGKTALERARTSAGDIIDRLGREDRLTLIRVTSRPEEMFSRFMNDTREIHERLEGLQVSSSRANLHSALLSLFGNDAPKRNNP